MFAYQTKRFKKGSGCFTCKSCGMKTRDVGDNGDLEMCITCYDMGGLENMISDGDKNSSEIIAAIQELEEMQKQHKEKLAKKGIVWNP